MFVSPQRLPHLLPPSAYWADEQHRRERAAFLSGWHLVGTTAELARDGDFLTCELLGHAIQVRNFGGALRALSNVCAHRHCLISSETRGRSPAMRCQYHGWEYGADGKARHIPEPKNFAPLQRGQLRLPSYRVETCGQLVFVSPAAEGPALREHLGDVFDLCAERFGPAWRPFLAWDPEYPANWKVPVENSLEAYHVPSVHPATFRSDPGEARSEHQMDRCHTMFRTTLPFSPHSRLDAAYQRCEAKVLRWLGRDTTAVYEQHHVFPNLLFSFTDALSLCHCVLPTGPKTSRAVVRQFGWNGGRRGPRRWLAGLWGRLAAGVTRRILGEDLRLYPAIQRGLELSDQPGVLGRCEERIHALHVYLQDATYHGADAEEDAIEMLAGEMR